MEKSHITLAAVAKLAQVSKMSVSRVLNGQSGVSETTRQRIMQAVEHLGYVPNPGLRPHADGTKMIALLITDITTSYMGEIVRGVSSAAERLNYGLMLYTQGNVDSANHAARTNYYLSLLSNNMV